MLKLKLKSKRKNLSACDVDEQSCLKAMALLVTERWKGFERHAGKRCGSPFSLTIPSRFAL
jgi:hypothetical protein